MTDFEKEKAYQEALSYLNSSLSNDETVEQSLRVLESLGDYKDAKSLYLSHEKAYRERCEEKKTLAKRRRVTVILQRALSALGLLLATALICLLVYLIRLW